MPRSTVTIRDVAQHAGVSHQTVSRVINGVERVNPETRQKVETAITELGYSPNAIARFMAKGRTGTLACFAPNLTDYTFASLIEGAQKEAREKGYFLLSASAPDEAIFAGLIEQFVTSHHCEGVMVINPYADGRYELLPADFPLVLAGARPRENSTNSVALDDVAVGRQATQHLLDLGHRRIGMVTGPMAEDCAQDRAAGFEMTLRAADLEPDPALIIEGNWLAPSGYDALMQLAAAGDLPTAIFAQNDQMALGLLRAAREHGLALPEALSVIGVDDIPLVSYFDPPLTTIRQDFEAIGREATRLLIRAIEQPTAPHQHRLLAAELVKRRSTVHHDQ
ncbi:MAG: LacI family DNA-binding transcriptional regulator [Chloroflexi bacterium]|nr:LacI family DNA-binding transcriptional regulator [Chloroflexota bacterium]